MKSKPDVLNAVRALLELGAAGFVVRYGRPDGLDVDLLAVARVGRRTVIDLPPLDLLVVGLDQLPDLLQQPDLQVTEALLTGAFLWGNEAGFASARAAAREFRGTPEHAGRLWWMGVGMLDSCRPDAPHNAAIDADPAGLGRQLLTNLGYAVSFVTASRTLEAHVGVPTMDVLQQRNPLLADLRARTREHKQGNPVTGAEFRAWFARAEHYVRAAR